jgi:hypothetical protein
MLTEEQREYQRNWYYKNIEKRRADSRLRMKEWRKNNPTAAKGAVKRWLDKNPTHLRNYRLKKSYGISLVQWNELFSAQGGKCAICRNVATSDRHWHVDHCHETGAVRGILCNHCNLMIGHAKDNPETLMSAIEYIKR